MILSNKTIRKLVDDVILIEGFDEKKLQVASYDVTKGKVDRHYPDEIIKPGEFRLISTRERFNLPNNVAAMCKTKSSFARAGLTTADFGCWIDPGFSGNITMAVFNFGRDEFDLSKVDAIAQIIFMTTDEMTEGYSGHYQDSEGIVESRYNWPV